MSPCPLLILAMLATRSVSSAPVLPPLYGPRACRQLDAGGVGGGMEWGYFFFLLLLVFGFDMVTLFLISASAIFSSFILRLIL